MRPPALTGAELVRILARAGFVVARKRGSHWIIKHPDGRSTVIPVHSGETIGRGLLAKILRDVELGREDFQELLRPQR